MKIITKENDTNVIYIQNNDLMMLYNSGVMIPANVYDKVYNDDFFTNDFYKNDFYRFTDKESIDFLNNIDWIVDYKKMNRMHPYELNRHYFNVVNEINEFKHCYGDNPTSDDLKFEYNILNHKANSIKDFYLSKYCNLYLDYPVLPNYDDVVIDESENAGLIVCRGYDPNTLLLFKSNDEVFLGSDSINTQLISKAISKAINEDDIEDKELLYYHTSYNISPDYKYLIIRYRKCKNKKFLYPFEQSQCVNKHGSIRNKLNKVLKKKNENN